MFTTTTPKMSSPTSSDTFEPEASVLSDNTYRNNLQKMECIRTTLTKRSDSNAPKLNLPQMVVIGDQSAGKSAVMSTLTGVPFPSESGITTKCPAVVHTKHDPSCSDIKFTLENAKRDLEPHTFETLPDAILARQRELLATTDSKVIDTPIVIHAVGCMCNDLTLVDLPGIISNGSDEEKEGILTMIRTYITPVESLILVVTEAKQDEEGAFAIQLAREVDPDETRTLRILTKYDNFDTAENRVRANGWVCNAANTAHYAPHAVICRIGGKQYDEADEARLLAEQQLPKACSGVPSLRTRLSELLCKLIDTNLPRLQKQICHVRSTAMARLHEIGTTPPDNSAILARVLATLRRKNNGFRTHLEVKCTPSLNAYREAIHQTKGFLTAELVDEHHQHNAFHCPFFQGEMTFNTLLQLVRDEWLPLADTLHGEIANVLDTVFDIPTLPNVSQKLKDCVKTSWHGARQKMLCDLQDALRTEINKEELFKTMNHYLTARYNENLLLPEEVQEEICQAITLSTLGTPTQNTCTRIDIETPILVQSHESAHTSLVRVNLQQVQERVQEIMQTKLQEYVDEQANASLEAQHKTRVLCAAKANWSAAHKTVTDSALDVVRRTVFDAVEAWLSALHNDETVLRNIKEDAGITREREQCNDTIHDMDECEAVLREDAQL